MVAGLALSLLIAHGPAGAQTCGDVHLADVTAESGVAFRHETGARGAKHLPETMGVGLAFLDYDGDGWLDLYLVQSGPFPPDGSPAAANRLFRNLGGGRFADVTEISGAGHLGYGQGVVAADADGDGDVDLYLANFGPDALLRNRGDGTFTDATSAAAIDVDGWSSAAAFADGDGDGDLDLYVTRYVEYDPAAELFCGDIERGERDYCNPTLFVGAADRYFENAGDGRYRDATAAAGFAGATGKGLGVLFTDLDGDRRPDLYVANDGTSNMLFHNLGGRFEDVSLLSGAAANRDGVYEAGMGLAVGDLDGDGAPELVVTNFDVETNTLYRNLGGLQFEDVSAVSGFGLPSFNLLGFGIVLADLDRDGDLDAFVANGHISERPQRDNVTHAQRALLLLGDGRGRFSEVRCPVLDDHPAVARGLAVADWDNDGTHDLALTHSGGSPRLLANRTGGARWLALRLVGRGANTEAVGAEVVVSGAGGRQSRWVTAGDSYQSSSDRRPLFGLPAGGAAAVEVKWPGGTRTRLVTPPSDRLLVLVQPSPAAPERAAAAPGSPDGAAP